MAGIYFMQWVACLVMLLSRFEIPVDLTMKIRKYIAYMAAWLPVLLLPGWLAPSAAAAGLETPYLAEAVAAGQLPPLGQRLPTTPRVMAMDGPGQTLGKHGGTLRTFVRKQKDVKLFSVYGYARLVGYAPDLSFQNDILRDLEIEAGRVFTFRLRAGHRWSDGHPFTAEDFRYWWEEVANDPTLSPKGLPRAMMVKGEAPTFEVIDPLTVRYSWPRPNPFLLPRLASASPLLLYRPAHYLKQFNPRHADADTLAVEVKRARVRNWAVLHDRRDAMYLSTNPDLPTLQPWKVRTAPPTTRFVAERNPYFHRVDATGRQLPYIDRMIMTVVSPRLIAAKAGMGETHLQARGLFFTDYTFLKNGEASYGFETFLWRKANGAQIALYPNLNAADPGWGQLMRDVRFRRALSLAIDRDNINEFLYFGLARPGNNTVLAESPLFNDGYRTRWAEYDPSLAGQLLDRIGLTRLHGEEFRRMPDGRLLQIVVETSGEQSEQTDILELIEKDWREVGVKLLIKASHRDILRGRVAAGEAVMSVWSGLENGVPNADTDPEEFVPHNRINLQWPSWGLYEETSGASGRQADLPAVRELLKLNQAWLAATGRAERAVIWRKILSIHANQVFTIGTVSGVRQPVVVAKNLRNVPREGLYNWDPGAFFGIHNPDTFWFDD